MVPPRLQTLQRLYKVIAEGIPFRCNELFGAAKVLPLAIVANLSDSVGHDRERILGTQWIAFWSI